MKKSVSVVFEASPMVDNQKTGVGYYVDRLMRAMSENESQAIRLDGFFFDFFGRRGKKAPALPRVRFHKIRFSPGKLLSACRRLGFQPPLEFFIPRGSDVVLFTNYVSLPLLRRRKTALVVYDLGYLDHPEYIQPKNLAYLQRFCSRSIRTADLIVTISEYTRQRLLHHFPDLTARIIVTHIPPAPLTPQAPSILPPSLAKKGVMHKKYILYVGTVEPRKNIQNLIEAYVHLPAKTRSQYSLVLAGGKGWRDDAILTDIAQKQADGFRIIQTGYVTDVEKVALYENAACFVLPSHYEGFGMPILEALSHGIPTAISNIQVFHEVAADAAVYFDKDNPQDIAETITNLLSNTALQQKLVVAGKKRLATFSWEKNSRIVAEALRNLSS
jgi:glycosyltransferase involved in cell wall biosynthesis